MAQEKNSKRTTKVEASESDIPKEREYVPVVPIGLAHPVNGFVSFLREYAIVGLAVGFVIGFQVQTTVKQLIASFVNPLSSLLFGSKLSSETFTLHFHGHYARFGWGAFLYALIDLAVLLVIVYVGVKILRLDKLDKPKK